MLSIQIPINPKPGGVVHDILLSETFVFLDPAVRNPYFGPSSNVLPYTFTFWPPTTRILKPENPLTVKPVT
jgi:hypothetical protein